MGLPITNGHVSLFMLQMRRSGMESYGSVPRVPDQVGGRVSVCVFHSDPAWKVLRVDGHF